MKCLATTLCSVVLALVATKTQAVTSPSFKVKQIVLAGSGCKAAVDVKAEIRDGKIVLDLPAVLARIGKGTKLSEARKNCGAIINLDYAGDQQFRVKRIKARVHSTGPEALGLVRADVRQQGDTTVVFQDHELKGEHAPAIVVMDLGGVKWSSCENRRPLVVQLASKLGKVPGDGSTAEVGVEGPVELELEWRRCRKI